MGIKDEQLVSLNARTSLDSPLKRDSLVLLHSRQLNLRPEPEVYIDNTNVNFYNDEGDNLLHISFRRVEKEIVFNSGPVGGDWGDEERVDLPGVFFRDDSYVIVYDHGDRYQILIDGRTVHYFTKRQGGEGTSVGYSVNDGTVSPIFSSTLGVVPSPHLNHVLDI
ncbi:Galectin-3 [Aspergillus ruber CBS 135680]|uniref:Galectin n=1 Tax=Aspergillus ruber (strain CBS 135680) TaxID=1388766 RepID=A0A017SCJ0_ASPRC|nr:Galectin-3 [Aspergillus ruber CBS 135680]EYE94763.1 Galectin-3 [Aspergillus ruber CBS 135680]